MQSSAPRFDIYSLIHKGLRACFAQAQLNLGRLDWTDTEEVTLVMDEVSELLTFCRKHLEKENIFVHPAMESRRPGSACEAGVEHDHHERDIAALGEQVFTIRRLPALRREAAVHELYRALNHFIAENLVHMAMEEREHNRVLWETHTDMEIMGIENAIVSALTPADFQQSLRWMFTAMNAGERARFLQTVRDNAPEEAFSGVLLTVRPLLNHRDQLKLDMALNLERQPADYTGVV